MPAFRLHRPVEDEWARARDLRERAIRDTPTAYLETIDEVRARTEAEWRQRIRAHGERSVQIVAVAGDGTWVGNGVVFLSDGPPPYAGGTGEGAPRANLVGVWVDPAWRADAGVLDALLDEAVHWVVERGLAELFLHVGEPNLRARRAYEKRGFRATGIVVEVPQQPGIAEIEMRNALAGSLSHG
jgi:ribosomal protein S18 acetylase RimI-like enzyme